MLLQIWEHTPNCKHSFLSGKKKNKSRFLFPKSKHHSLWKYLVINLSLRFLHIYLHTCGVLSSGSLVCRSRKIRCRWWHSEPRLHRHSEYCCCDSHSASCLKSNTHIERWHPALWENMLQNSSCVVSEEAPVLQSISSKPKSSQSLKKLQRRLELMHLPLEHKNSSFSHVGATRWDSVHATMDMSAIIMQDLTNLLKNLHSYILPQLSSSELSPQLLIPSHVFDICRQTRLLRQRNTLVGGHWNFPDRNEGQDRAEGRRQKIIEDNSWD